MGILPIPNGRDGLGSPCELSTWYLQPVTYWVTNDLE